MENNDDFKYVIQDTGHVYLGKELTYQEILDKEDAPFKFKAIISAYVLKDTTVDVKLTDHIMTVQPDAFSTVWIRRACVEGLRKNGFTRSVLLMNFKSSMPAL